MEIKQNYFTFVLVVGLVVVALVLANNARQKVIVEQGNNQRDIVSVSGTSSLTVEPNKAEIYAKIITLEKNAQDSKNRNSQTSSSVIAALKNEGVKDADIETSQFSIYPKYEYEEAVEGNLRKSKQILVGYETVNVLKATTLNLDKVGKIIDTVVDSGANDVERISFGLTKEKEKELKQQAMILASNDAKEKAQALTNNLGARLGKITTITESSFIYQPYDYYPRSAFAKDMAESAPSTQINPQKLDVSATVNLVYEIG